VVLSALLVYGLALAGSLVSAPAAAPLRIAVVGERWWWRVDYLAEDGGAIQSANEIRIPMGRPVEFILTSPNVIHSFWVPNLGGKLDMIPGRENRFVLRAEREGIYRGQCAEYCGGQHALMAFSVIAETPAAFEAWIARRMESPPLPADATLQRGLEVFMTSGCGACHTIRGTDAAGVVGPDLTDVGGRLTLAAGTLPNDIGSLMRWIAHAQDVKPGSLMPSFGMLAEDDLSALAAYLESLK
jgi:cytochrome c oxidase subunit 2